MFVIYHMPSTMEMGPTPYGNPHSHYAKKYKTFGGALKTAMKWNAKEMGEKAGPGPYCVASLEVYYAKVVKKVEKVNMMSGLKYWEASNTPGYCSPSSEAYWSM